MKNELTVDDNGEWCAAFAQDQYLVSDKVLAALNEGMKTWHIERDFVEGLDYKKVGGTNKDTKRKPLPLPLGIALAFILSPLLFLACPFLMFKDS